MIEQLQHASVGRPITKNGIALHPVYLHGSSETTVDFGHVIVEELGSASVPTLRATNPAAHPSVILEGELVFGGLQDRIINSTIIVPANSSIEVPVSCVEQGRWSNEGSFSRGWPPCDASSSTLTDRRWSEHRWSLFRPGSSVGVGPP